MDKIPDDALTQILSYNIGTTTEIFGKPLPFVDTTLYARQALQCSLSNAFFRRLFCKTLSNTLFLTNYTPFTETFKQVFYCHIHHLFIENYDGDFKRLLRSPSLGRLTLHTVPKNFSLSNCTRNLRALYINVERRGELTSIRNGIVSLGLEELGISYDAKLHSEVKRVTKDIAKRSRRIRTLAIEPSNSDLLTWPMIQKFRNIKNATLTHEISSKAMQKVRHMKSVKIKTTHRGIVLAESLGNLVVSVDLLKGCPHHALTSQDMIQLSACSRLTVLKAYVRRGVERELHRISGNLKELEIEWIVTSMLPATSCEIVASDVTKLQEGCMIPFVREAPRLTSISLFGASMTSKEIESILAIAGKRLYKLGLSVENQETLALNFIVQLLEQLAEHNNSLQELNFRAESLDTWTDLGVTGCILLDEERRSSLERCLETFHRRVPCVQMLPIVSLLERVMRIHWLISPVS